MDDSVLPPGPHEAAITAIWRDVLGRSDIGVLDDFFELNGTSLQAIDLVARIRETWGVDIRARDFFGNPTVQALAAAVAAAAPSSRSTVGPRAADADPVLSFDQQRIWLDHQLRPGTAYNVHGRCRLVGPLDLGALEAGIRAIVARHEALRTRFPSVDGEPVQVVDDPDEHWRIERHDLSGVAGDRANAARRLADAQAAVVFDLAQGPLFRCLLITLSDTEHVLSVTAHHIACDDWSIGLFVREFIALYEAGGDVDRAGLPVLPVQSRDYAVWQRQYLAGDALDAEVDYWRQHLAGAPPAIALPTIGSRSPFDGGDGVAGRRQAALSKTETAALHELCHGYGVTPFMALLAALATVLGRWSGQPDVVIGVPITGRTRVGIEQLIGFFGNTLALRIGLTGEPTFAELVGRVRQDALGGYAHADVPMDFLVKELRVARDPSRTPLFQVVLNVIDSPDVEQLSDLVVEALEVPEQSTKFELAIVYRPSRGTLRLDGEFNTDRHQPAMIGHLVDQVCTLLRAVLEDPSKPIHAYSLETGPGPAVMAAERAPVAPRLTIERHAQNPDRVAVIDKDGEWGYRWLGDMFGGAVLVRPERSFADDADALGKWLQTNAITVLFVRPPLLRLLTAQAQPGQLRALRYVFVDNRGDLLSRDVELVRAAAPECRCVGVYRAGSDDRPLATYVVPDDWRPDTAPLRVPLGTGLQAAAVGEIAEIRVGDRPTGDLGRRWADGTVEYIGRVGGSPDPDMIETLDALRRAPGVRDALVTDHAGYVAHPGAEPGRSVAEVRQHLVTRLAERLIPAHLIVLDHLPLTADGDYDLGALPGPDEPADTYVAPRTPMEQQLAEMLQDVLSVDRVGTHNSFFDLGGFSLLATRLTSRIREVFDVELSLRDLFGSPTVERLAQHIVRVQAEKAGADDLAALWDEIESPDEVEL
jgi:acyl carrier protein